MGEGIFAELQVRGPASCQLLTASEDTEPDATIGTVTRSTIPDDEGTITEEFTVEPTNEATEACDGDTEDPLADVGGIEGFEDATRVFDSGSGTVYRFDREQRGCACDRIEALGCPIWDVDIWGDRIVLTFFTADVETLREVITDLKGQFESVSVERLLRSDPADADRSESDLAFVDRGDRKSVV